MDLVVVPKVSLFMLAAGLLWSLEESASACEVWQQGALPENAAVMLSLDCEDSDAVITVEVDGLPAQVVPCGLQAMSGYAGCLDIVPQPVRGQRVVVSVDEVEYGLAVGEPDTTPPSLEDVELSIGEPARCLSCPDMPEPTGNVVQLSWQDRNNDGATVYVVDFVVDGEAVEDGVSQLGLVGVGRAFEEGVSEACVELTAIDAAGNMDVAEVACVEEDPLTDRGCGCTSGRESGWGALALLGLLGMRRRASGYGSG